MAVRLGTVIHQSPPRTDRSFGLLADSSTASMGHARKPYKIRAVRRSHARAGEQISTPCPLYIPRQYGAWAARTARRMEIHRVTEGVESHWMSVGRSFTGRIGYSVSLLPSRRWPTAKTTDCHLRTRRRPGSLKPRRNLCGLSCPRCAPLRPVGAPRVDFETPTDRRPGTVRPPRDRRRGTPQSSSGRGASAPGRPP